MRSRLHPLIGSVRVLVLTAGVLLVLHPVAHGFRKDEVECEEAVARLQKCCSEEQLAGVNCVYDAGCGATLPDISVAESRCLRDLSCRQIADANICQRIFDKIQGTLGTDAPEQLCP